MKEFIFDLQLFDAGTTEITTLDNLRTALSDTTTTEITLSSQITINSNTTIDLNGHKVTYTGTSPAFNVTGGTLTITDSTASSGCLVSSFDSY